MPEISIIVPVYNSEKYIEKCLKSILSQTFFNIEIIVINDGSTDNTYQVCSKVANSDSRIKLIDRSNSGVSASRNYGLRIAKGKYIMFCDSDDYVDPKWCELMWNKITKHNNSYVVCGSITYNLDTENKQYLLLDKDKECSILEIDNYYHIFNIGTSGSLWNKIFDLSIIKENSIKFNEELSFAEDVLFNSEYIKYCNNIIFINLPLYIYCVRNDDNSLSRKYYKNYFEMVKITYECRKQLISKKFFQEYCSMFFYNFNNALKMTFNKNNKSSIFNKIRTNQNYINDSSFLECISNMKVKKEDMEYIKMLRKGNYYIIYIRSKFAQLRKKLRGENL